MNSLSFFDKFLDFFLINMFIYVRLTWKWCGISKSKKKIFFDFEIPHHFHVKLTYINIFIKKKSRKSSKITHEFILAHPVEYWLFVSISTLVAMKKLSRTNIDLLIHWRPSVYIFCTRSDSRSRHRVQHFIHAFCANRTIAIVRIVISQYYQPLSIVPSNFEN